MGNIYRPNSAPHANIKYFNQTISDIFSKIKSDVNEVIVAGDMNTNLLNHTNHIDTGLYLDTLLENSFLPLISLPTRIAGSSATLLDHIVTNIADDTYDSGIIPSDISDNFSVLYIRHFKDKSAKVNPVKTFRKFAPSISMFKTMLENENWDILLNTDQETSFKVFFKTTENCFKYLFPENKTISANKSKPYSPWMSEALIISRKNKNRFFIKKLSKPCPETKMRFKEYNKVYIRLVRVARKKFYDVKSKEYSKDCKKNWQTINSVLGRGRKSINIPDTFLNNGVVLSGTAEISEGFNTFFLV